MLPRDQQLPCPPEVIAVEGDSIRSHHTALMDEMDRDLDAYWDEQLRNIRGYR